MLLLIVAGGYGIGVKPFSESQLQDFRCVSLPVFYSALN